MADLVLNWGALGAFGTNLVDTDELGGAPSATVDTGGVAVDITYDGQAPGSQAFTFNAPAYVEAGETLDPQSHLKLFGEWSTGDNSVVELDFRSTDAAQFTDEVQNVSFRLNDVDSDVFGDLDGDTNPAGNAFEDIVNIRAFDANGNEVPVTFTPAGTATVVDNTVDGNGPSGLDDPAGSVLVEIAGPVARIVVDYDNGGINDQRVLISDVEFSTVDVGDNIDPVAVDDTATTDLDTPVVITDPSGNDTDADGDPLTTTSIGTPTNGTATLNGDGTVTYTPDAGFTGDDTISYVVSDGQGGSDTGEIVVSVTDGAPPANIPPTAVDDTATTAVGTPVTLDPAANDTDPDAGDALETVAVGTPTNGAATLNGDGTVTYTPDAGFTGDDTIPYTVSDGNGGSDTGEIVVTVADPGPGRIDTDVFPVVPGLQVLDPLNNLDEDPDPSDDLDNEVGTSGGDFISTGDDADTIDAGAGNDTVEPGIDDDLVDLGGGDDLLVDVQGADTISGGQGNDTINAGTNTFSDYENDDPNFAPGSLFFDTFGFSADPNQDDGRDSVQGNAGDDLIFTGDDRDTIDGGGDNDTIDAGIDDDLVMGGQGDDSLIGSHGSDTLDGGQGNDYIDGSNLAALEQTDDVDVNTENDRDLLQGFLGDDTLIGGDDDDTLQGGSGNDFLNGGIDEDLMTGGNDRDTFFNITAGDTIDGSAGGDDFDTIDLTGAAPTGGSVNVTYTGPDSNGNGFDGFITFRDASGTTVGTTGFTEIEDVIPCFTPGTLIATPEGERLVEDLKVGDRVITRDNGIQMVKWVGRKDLTGHDLARKPHFKPILICQGALGNNLPEHDMMVSPNHRVLVANDKTALYFEEREVLVAAKHLVGLEGVEEVEVGGVAYIHIMFENHEVVLSNGAWTESFQPGDYSLRGIGNAQRQEILELFPELAETEGLKAYTSARRSLKKHEAALLVK